MSAQITNAATPPGSAPRAGGDRRGPILWGMSALVAASIPLWVPDYYVHLFVFVGIFVILTASLNLIGGFAGFMSLGHAAFWGIGAYTSAQVALALNASPWLGFLAAFAFAGVAGGVVALPCLRLSGIYVTMVTIAFGVIAHLVFANWSAATGGAVGLGDIPRPSFLGMPITTRAGYSYLVLIAVMATMAALRLFLASRTGQATIAARDDELAAQCSGIDIVRTKLLAFVLSSAFAGLAGALYAHYVTYINPDSFTVWASIRILVMVVVGGLASLGGSVIGAVVVYLLPEFLRFLDVVYLLVYALLIIGMMLFLPSGLVSLPRRIAERRAKRKERP